MKKLLALLAALLLVTGCTSTTTPETSEEPTVEPTEETTGSYKAGTGASGKVSSKDGGVIQIDTTICGVVVDENDTIVYVSFDTAQNKGSYDEAGVVSTETAVKDSKKVLKEEYGMKGASAIGKEWYEQIAAFEELLVGKTTAEALAFAKDEAGKPTDADVLTSVSMKVGGYLEALQDAVNNLVEVEKAESFGFANVTDMKTKDASADADGSIEFTTTYALVGLNGETVVSTLIDVAQEKAFFNAAGEFNTEKSVFKNTKKVLKDEYGMKGASAIGKEWYEQIAALEGWTLGKTVSEVSALEVDEKGVPTDADVVTSVTIKTGSYMKAFEAAANASN